MNKINSCDYIPLDPAEYRRRKIVEVEVCVDWTAWPGEEEKSGHTHFLAPFAPYALNLYLSNARPQQCNMHVFRSRAVQAYNTGGPQIMK